MAQSHTNTHASDQGSMDVSMQSETWTAFTHWAKWGTLIVLGFVFFLLFWLVGNMSLPVAAALIGALVGAASWFFGSAPGLSLGVFVGLTVLGVIASIIGAIFAPLFG